MNFENSGSLSSDSLDTGLEGSIRLSVDSLDRGTSKEGQGDFNFQGCLPGPKGCKGLKTDSIPGYQNRDFLGDDCKDQEKDSDDDCLEGHDFQGDDCKSQDKDSAADYLDREVFPVLLPAFEKMLFAARENDVLRVQKSRFNGLDYLAEHLWNRNPQHPERAGNYKTIFEIPFAQEVLELTPRPVFPRSWLWTPEEAAVVLQAAVRGFLVRARPDVQEMRQFWRALALERRRSSQLEGSSGKASSSGRSAL